MTPPHPHRVVPLLPTLAAAAAALAVAHATTVPSVRVPLENRTFTSLAVDAKIRELVPQFQDPNLATLFENCWPNTLDSTVKWWNATDTFVITGDITAMWLRDSTNQVLPYMDFVHVDEHLSSMVQNLVRRQAHSVLVDAYANAFNFNASGQPPSTQQHQDDERTPPMTPPVFEGKYELDSLCAFFKLSFAVWNATAGAATCFDGQWADAVDAALTVVEDQQQDTAQEGSSPSYTFQRTTAVATDTQMQSGRGPPASACGLSKCAFRPSDDAVTLPFLVPANAMAVVELRHVASMCGAMAMDDRAARAAALADAIDAGLQATSIIYSTSTSSTSSGSSSGSGGDGGGRSTGIFAFEIDGFGSKLFMDDANVPSLLSLPFLGYVDASDPVYQNTRQAVLSPRNPFWFAASNSSQGVPFEGVGSPHTGYRQIWPMSLIMRALTSDEDDEILACLDMLIAASTDTGYMHESFNATDASQYTRSWFAWANSLFGELVLKVARERPWLILKSGGSDASA